MSTKILVVDDSVFIRRSVSTILKQNNYEVLEAEDGEEGLNVAKENKVSLILTDINMPRMNGLEMIKKIRQMIVYKLTPILVLTTESQGDIIEEGKKAGASGWLVKPFSNEKLIETIESVL